MGEFCMREYNDILEKILSVTNIINKTSKCPRDFDVGFILYPSEIHTIEAIGNHENINANLLSKVLGITNGAVTQMTDKLIKKGLISKYKIETNKKEVYFKLTELGNVANQSHYNFHEQAYKNIVEYLDKLKPNQINAILGFLDIYIENLPSK